MSTHGQSKVTRTRLVKLSIKIVCDVRARREVSSLMLGNLQRLRTIKNTY